MKFAVADKIAAQQPQTLKGKIDKLLVDADGLCYFCAGAESTSPGQALMNVEEKLKAVESVAGMRATLVCTAGESPKGGRYFQASIKPYQGQRSGKNRPKNWEFLRGRMLAGAFGRELLVETYAEADDLCRQMAGPRTALHYQDKDFQMMPGWHITWKDYELVNVPEDAYCVIHGTGLRYSGNANYIGKVYGLKWFWLQMLMGDNADNIPGLEKLNGKLCGPGAAEKLLADAETEKEAAIRVVAAYAATYPDTYTERILEQAQLLWMRRNVLDDLDCIRPGGPLHRFPVFKEMHDAATQGE